MLERGECKQKMIIGLNVILGTLLGIFFAYAFQLKWKKGIIGIGLCTVAFYIACMKITTPASTIIMYIAIILFAFESVSDLKDQHTYTIPIYAGIAVIAGLRLWQIHMQYGMYLFICLYLTLAVAAICYNLHLFANHLVGQGDVDMYFLCFLAMPVYGIILIMVTLLAWLWWVIYQKITKRRDNFIESENHQEDTGTKNKKEWEDKKIAAVPFLFLGYLIFLVLI